MKHLFKNFRWQLIGITALALTMVFGPPSWAQQQQEQSKQQQTQRFSESERTDVEQMARRENVDWSEWEYEWDEGLHREEWYDPSDWFDVGGGISHERDWYDHSYGMNGFETPVYGYYGEDYYEETFDPEYRYDYYAEDWYEERDLFD